LLVAVVAILLLVPVGSRTPLALRSVAETFLTSSSKADS